MLPRQPALADEAAVGVLDDPEPKAGAGVVVRVPGDTRCSLLSSADVMWGPVAQRQPVTDGNVIIRHRRKVLGDTAPPSFPRPGVHALDKSMETTSGWRTACSGIQASSGDRSNTNTRKPRPVMRAWYLQYPMYSFSERANL